MKSMSQHQDYLKLFSKGPVLCAFEVPIRKLFDLVNDTPIYYINDAKAH